MNIAELEDKLERAYRALEMGRQLNDPAHLMIRYHARVHDAWAVLERARGR